MHSSIGFSRQSFLISTLTAFAMVGFGCGGDNPTAGAGTTPETPPSIPIDGGENADAGSGGAGIVDAGDSGLGDAGGSGSDAGGTSTTDGGGTPVPDGGETIDAGGSATPDAGVTLDAGRPGPSGGPCAPGAYRCNGNAVEICNSSGTAWLFSATCAIGCTQGLCTGACTPSQRRCNANIVQECNAQGTTWNNVQTCTTFCDTGRCALASLDVATNTTLDGDQVVAGGVIVRAPATLSSPTGNLTIRAASITVENGAFVTVAPTGTTPDGTGLSAAWYGGAGGGYGSNGSKANGNATIGGTAHGRANDADVVPGSAGGAGSYNSESPRGGKGGGVLKLVADTIAIAGQVTANGEDGVGCVNYCGGGGGSGGGILIAADNVTISGTVSTRGGLGGVAAPSSSRSGGAGGQGRIKILSGATKSLTGTLSGVVTDGVLPPLTITSTTHPDSAAIYNDDFAAVSMAWNRPFASQQGYYRAFNQTVSLVPSPANALFMTNEFLSVPRASLQGGDNFFHIVSIDSRSVVGQVESRFKIRVNTQVPVVSSSSHPGGLSSNPDAFFAWTFPTPDSGLKGARYVFDRFANTIPTHVDTLLPTTQKQLLISAIQPGAWFFHVLTEDTLGYLTRAAAHYRVDIGTAYGSIAGKVISDTSQSLQGATVTLGRGAYAAQTNSAGDYSFAQVTPGEYELRVSKTGFQPSTRSVTVAASATATENVTLVPGSGLHI